MGLSTHVLDLTHGRPAAGMRVRLEGPGGPIADAITNADGRLDEPLLAGDALTPGRYRLTFSVAAYFAGLGVALPDPPFLDDVVLQFGVSDASAHYHVPLLVSPYGYSTYRGS